MKNIKKTDYIIIGIVFCFIILFYAFFLTKTFSRNSDTVIGIYYKNELIYELEEENNESDEETIYIVAKDGKLKLTSNGLEKLFDIDKDISFYNTLEIKNGVIKMIDASCKNHYCMNMKINKTFNTCIVCTNGIIVKMESEEIEIIS